MSEPNTSSKGELLPQPPPLDRPIDVCNAAEKLAPHERQELIRYLVTVLRKNGKGVPRSLSGWTDPEAGGIGEDEYGYRRWMSAAELRERGLPG
jgi:hypothetical protein